MSESVPIKAERIDVLDYARFVAAVAVMLFHYADLSIRFSHAPFRIAIPGLTDFGKYGYLGVELFFMISGFVIFNSTKGRTASQFATARALRLYPAFIVCVLLTSAAVFYWGMPSYRIKPMQFFANLVMVPGVFGQTNIDGSYWSLAVEIKFYAVILLLMLLGFAKKLNYFFLAWPVLLLLSSFLGFQWPQFLKGYDSYFCAGAIFAIRRTKKSIILDTLLLVCLYFSLELSAVKNLEVRDLHPLSPFIATFFVVAFYVFFWALSNRLIDNVKLPFAKLVGGVTYPLYLIHQTVGYIIIRHFGNEQNKASVVLIVMIVMVMVGCFLHVYAEQKTENFWKAVFKKVVGMPVGWLEATFSNLQLKVGGFIAPR